MCDTIATVYIGNKLVHIRNYTHEWHIATFYKRLGCSTGNVQHCETARITRIRSRDMSERVAAAS